MRPIRGLLVDNDEGNATLIEQTLNLEFERFGWNVVWTTCRDALSARSTVRRVPEPFDFAIVDLFLGAEREGGIPVVRELRARDERTFVLVVTSRPERNGAYLDESRAAGAVHALIRVQLSHQQGEWSFSRLADKIRVHLLKHDLVAAGSMIFDNEDPGILAVLESVGGAPWEGSVDRGLRVVRSLAIDTLKPTTVGPETLKLRYMVPGRSGAFVCQVDVQVPDAPVRYYVLKFGLDRQALEHERRLNAEAVDVLGHQVLVPVVGDVEVDPSSGYCAIAFKVADGTSTLGRWLHTTTEQDGRELAAVLFGEYLAKLFAARSPESRPAGEWMRTPAVTRLRAEAVLDGAMEALAHPRGGALLEDVGSVRDTVIGFLSTGILPVEQPERLRGHVPYVLGFGDLQPANVLVTGAARPRPVLIDASRYGSQHWAADCARMLVDLVLRVCRAGTAALLWEDFGAAAADAYALCPECRRHRLAGSTGAAGAFIDEAVGRLTEFLHVEQLRLLADAWHWQWHVALAKEFLRQASHPDLTPPRSALALVAAAEHLQLAAASVDSQCYHHT